MNINNIPCIHHSSGEPEEMRLHGRLRRSWKDYIDMDFKNIGFEILS
jgi:hypothetical protein